MTNLIDKLTDIALIIFWIMIGISTLILAFAIMNRGRHSHIKCKHCGSIGTSEPVNSGPGWEQLHCSNCNEITEEEVNQ